MKVFKFVGVQEVVGNNSGVRSFVLVFDLMMF
jgi:hypothetical protein